ncbi:peptide-methionine (R)-S-oxide reductase MsrB [Halosimplex salinum]|uniref:peptide-methionine (R)-S-oxide reductase MsrB n=1 Tax=Halosimplex salinum TaxID=1710538 RepID=UPI000F4AEBAC|nr:peptide-methionine (R)-S-oxide reductase MsrB [Halosimplex salinum]
MSEQDATDALPESEAEWRERLSPDAYRILRESGTEPRYSSDLLDVKGDGEFRCAGCGQTLFTSDEKFDSGTGWPSFWAPADEDAVATRADRGLLSTRTEVLCSRCEGHLGHVFDDGPKPTGKRYCINGDGLTFEADE